MYKFIYTGGEVTYFVVSIDRIGIRRDRFFLTMIIQLPQELIDWIVDYLHTKRRHCAHVPLFAMIGCLAVAFICLPTVTSPNATSYDLITELVKSVDSMYASACHTDRRAD